VKAVNYGKKGLSDRSTHKAYTHTHTTPDPVTRFYFVFKQLNLLSCSIALSRWNPARLYRSLNASRCAEWQSGNMECHGQKIGTWSDRTSQMSVTSLHFTFFCFHTSPFALHTTPRSRRVAMSPCRFTFIFSTARPPRPRLSALSSLPHPPNSSPSPILQPTSTSTLSLTSPATSRPLSRPYCRDHLPQNTDSDFFLIARGGTGRQRRHRTSTRRTFG